MGSAGRRGHEAREPRDWAGVADPPFERLARLAARVVDVPVGLVSILSGDRLRVKGATGLPAELLTAEGEIPVEIGFCREVVEEGEPLAVTDAREDASRRGLPAVAEHGAVAYLGLPLRSASGAVVGVLALIDDRPRQWTPEQRALAGDVAASAEAELEWRRDLTGRLEAERELRQQDVHLRMVLDQAPTVLWTTDRDLRITSVRGGVTAMDREGFDALVGRTIDQFFRDAGAPNEEAVAAHEQALCGEPGEYEAWYAGAVLQAVVEPLVGDGGAVVGVIGLAFDVTARKQAEDVVREREAHFRALVENAPDAVSVLAAGGRLLYHTPALERMTGLTGAELRTRDPFERMHEEDLPRVRRAFRELLERPGGTASAEYRTRGPDGSWLVLEATATNRLDDPAVRGLVVNVRNVTAQRALEERLRQAQKMEAVGRLAGGVAHDFNNMLTAITGYASLLEPHVAQDGEALELLQEIRAAADRSTDLTRQLLAFGRSQILRPERLDLNAVVRGVEKMLRRVIGEDIQLETRLAGERCPVEADRTQLEQVVLNLAVNARDAMPHGGRLAIRTEQVELDEGSFVRLTVEDTGVGMDPETLSHVFEPFFTTKTVGKGTGLGLATVHGIVEQSGGFTRVRSAPGEGATFAVYLPWADAARGEPGPRGARADDPDASAAPDSPECGEAGPGAEGRGRTVLVVEDEAVLRDLTTTLLRRAGYRVVAAADGQEALLLTDRMPEAPDLLFTDVVLPEMSGRELAEAVRERRPNVRVLFTSGYTDDFVLRAGVSQHRCHFLPKPFDREELLSKIRSVLGGG